MRKLTTSLLPATILLAGVLPAAPLCAQGGGMMHEQCGMMQGRQGGMMGRGGMMQGDRGGMMGQGGMMGEGGMMQDRREGMMNMMKRMSQMMKQMSQMMDQYSSMMGDNRPSDREKSAPSEPEKK